MRVAVRIELSWTGTESAWLVSDSDNTNGRLGESAARTGSAPLEPVSQQPNGDRRIGSVWKRASWPWIRWMWFPSALPEHYFQLWLSAMCRLRVAALLPSNRITGVAAWSVTWTL